LLHRPGLERWEEFTCLNSLRDVEPPVKFVLDDGGLDEITVAPAVSATHTDGAAVDAKGEGTP
jgi:hypothetical protein